MPTTVSAATTNTNETRSIGAVVVCSLIFLASGFSSLTFQVAWRRVLSQEIGVDYAAVTFIVAIFIAGLGIGALAGGSLARRFASRPPLVIGIYAACEILIGPYGFTSEPLLRWIGEATAASGIHSLPVLFVFFFAALVIPTMLMGATLPLMLQVGERFIPEIGINIGLLYGINIIGAAFGALIADFYLLEFLGVRSTIDAASILNLCFPIVFVALLRIAGRVAPSAVSEVTKPRVDGSRSLLAISVAFGFLTLSLEIVLFRVTAHYLQSDAYAFSIMLFCYLLMMGAGNFVFGALTERWSERVVMLAITIGFFASMIATFYTKEIITVLYPASSIINPARFGTVEYDRDKIIATMVIMLPVFFASGLFPYMIRTLCRDRANVGMATGRVYFCYALGNTAGVLMTGLVIVPTIGTIDASRLLVALAALAMIGVLYMRRVNRPAATGTIAVAAVIAAVLLPSDYFLTFHSIVAHDDLGYPYRIIEGKTGVLAIFKKEHVFELNGTKYTGGAVTNAWADIGYVPAMLVGRPIKRALVIGAGHGDQALALDSLPSHPVVDVAEISDELIAAQRDDTIASKIGAAYFRGKYGIRVHVIDGRRWVNQAYAEGTKYDVIQLGITMPQSGTSGNLYTREMFKKLYDILADDGVLMVYSFRSALRTGLEIFPHAYFLSGIPNVLAFTGEVFMTKHAMKNIAWNDAALQRVKAICDGRSMAVQHTKDCPIAITPTETIKLLEVPRSLVHRYPVNTDDNVIMTFDKLWQSAHPGQARPGSRLWLTYDLKDVQMPMVPITRIKTE